MPDEDIPEFHLRAGHRKRLLRPVNTHGCYNPTLHKGLVDTQNMGMGNSILLQQSPGKLDVFLCIPGFILQNNVLFRNAAFHGNLSKADSLRFRKHTFGIPSQSAGEQDFRSITLVVQFRCPAGNVRIEIAEAYNHISLNRFLVHAQIVPDHLQRF